MTPAAVRTGAAQLAADPSLLAGERVGLLTNFTGTMPSLERSLDAFLASGVRVTCVFTPEHGLRGTAQAGESEHDTVDETTGLPVIDTYGSSGAALDELISRDDVDVIVFDMQDIGVRYWTYTWTMFDAMASAARSGKRFVVLDRPNPLGGTVTAGAGVSPEFSSFVGRADIPQRHGLTSGELARLFNLRFIPELAGSAVDLRVVPLEGWGRGTGFAATGLPWVMPSPNLPTLDSVRAFAGTGLFEGTNLSEGRGTTRPFELIGAPYIDGRFIRALRDRQVPGVAFREVWFAPTFHKHAGQTARGVQLHVEDPELFDPIRCALTMIGTIASLYPGDFEFLGPRDGGIPPERGYAIDRLWGSSALRDAVGRSEDPVALAGPTLEPGERYPEGVLLYPADGTAQAAAARVSGREARA